jgi:C4-dicarboxylate-specific signal transduction histidine kinase
VDTTLRAHRAGQGNRALRIGLGSVFFVMTLSLQMILVLWGFVEAPITASLFFTAMLGVMSFELSSDVLRAANLTSVLQSRERDLRRERDLSNAVFNNAPGIIQLHSAEGRILRSNSREALHLDATNGVDGPFFWEIFRNEDRKSAEADWQDAWKSGHAEFELDLVDEGGALRRFFFIAAKVEIDNAPQMVLVGVDATTQHQLAAQASRQRDELAHLARIAAVSELSSSLAHEINQPLAIILSNAEAAQRLLASGKPDLAEVAEILRDIIGADVRAANVIRRLRAILRRGEPELEPVMALELASRVVALAKPEIEAAGASVALNIPKRLPEFRADRIPLEQVLLNLVKNACEAMDQATGVPRRITISASSADGHIVFSVRDNGCGLPPDSAEIFEAFKTTKPKGLGLGLKICRSIVQAHGGRIWAEQNRGRGATFRFSIPLDPEKP